MEVRGRYTYAVNIFMNWLHRKAINGCNSIENQIAIIFANTSIVTVKPYLIAMQVK